MKAVRSVLPNKQDRQLISLPPSVVDIYGVTVDLSGEKWSSYRNPERRGVVVFNVGVLRRPRVKGTVGPDGRFVRRESSLAKDLTALMELFVARRLQTHTPLGARAAFLGFVNFEYYIATIYRWGTTKNSPFKSEDIGYDVISSYSRWIFETAPDNCKYVSFMRQFYSFCIELGCPGFNRKTMRHLRDVVAKTPPKARIARLRDPRKGAFVWEEQQQIIRALERKVGEDEDRALVQLFHETGIRLEAAIRLRKRHVRVSPSMGEYFLDVPRVKQRKPTNQLKEMVISESLAVLLVSLLPDAASDDEFLLHWVFERRVSGGVQDQLARWAQAANLLTLRLEGGRPTALPLAPYRFRRTLATNLAENGAPPEVIAEFLDDRSLAMAVTYTSNASSIVEVLARTLDQHPSWFRLLGLFQGKVQTKQDGRWPEIFGGVPALTDYGEFFERIGAIGQCAKQGACVLRPPLSCYNCVFFRPSQDVRKHEAQLEQLGRELDAAVGSESDRIAGALRGEMVSILSTIACIRESAGAASHCTDRRARIGKSIAREGTPS